jgi:RNA polymerase sigma factor (sigma-70 family)
VPRAGDLGLLCVPHDFACSGEHAQGEKMTQDGAAMGADGAMPSDADLIDRSRTGDKGAFAELWRRHYVSGLSVARSITAAFDADDLVQEAFSRIFQSVQRGGGPTGSFRAYLFTIIRNTAADWGRSRADTAFDDVEEVADPDAASHVSDEAHDRSLTHEAFQTLPKRWQEVLWYTEVEAMKPAEVAPLLGMKPPAVAQLAFRAREGLREAWIQAHLQEVDDGSECRWATEHLGAYTRGNLGARDLRRMTKHLEECERCSAAAVEAKEVSRRLALVLLPLIVGSGATVTALAALREGAGAAVAVAAMPSTVVSGAAASASAASGSAGGAVGAGAAGGTLAGLGTSVALLAAGVAVIAGVSLTVTQSSSPPPVDPLAAVVEAEAARDAAASPSPEPDPSASMTPSGSLFVQPSPTSTPSPSASARPGPIAPVVRDKTPPVTAPAPIPEPTPTPEPTPVIPVPVPTPEPTPTPTPEPTPEPTPTPTPEPTPTPTPEPTPIMPTGSPVVSSAETALIVVEGDDILVTEVRMAVAGAAGATVQALTDGDVRATTTLDESGSGVLVVRPTLSQILRDTTIDLRYIAGTQTGGLNSIRLSDLL